jgi:hypothetical protein
MQQSAIVSTAATMSFSYKMHNNVIALLNVLFIILHLSVVKDIWLDDENDLIRSCGALSKALGKDNV